uniref:Putative secreted protein n=1 Tax=Anopheles darlingi TaxID=43151 RepID=A0A2M4DHI5_ANODA
MFWPPFCTIDYARYSLFSLLVLMRSVSGFVGQCSSFFYTISKHFSSSSRCLGSQSGYACIRSCACVFKS